MWVNRKEYLDTQARLIERIAEYKAMYQAEHQRSEKADEALADAITELKALKVRLKELEGKLLQREDEMAVLRKQHAAASPPMVLDDSIFDEDPERVKEMRRRIERDGTGDMLLTEEIV